MVVVGTPCQPETKFTNWRFQPNDVSHAALPPFIEINLLKGPYWAFGTNDDTANMQNQPGPTNTQI